MWTEYLRRGEPVPRQRRQSMAPNGPCRYEVTNYQLKRCVGGALATSSTPAALRMEWAA